MRGYWRRGGGTAPARIRSRARVRVPRRAADPAGPGARRVRRPAGASGPRRRRRPRARPAPRAPPAPAGGPPSAAPPTPPPTVPAGGGGSAADAQPPSRSSHGDPYAVSRSRKRNGVERLRTQHPRPRPRARRGQLQRHDRVDRRLPHHCLAAVLAHRPGVVDDVVEVDLPRGAVRSEAAHPQARAGLPGHRGAERRRVGQAGRHHLARRHRHVPDPHRLRRGEPQLVQRPQGGDHLVAEPVLEGHPLAMSR